MERVRLELDVLVLFVITADLPSLTRQVAGRASLTSIGRGSLRVEAFFIPPLNGKKAVSVHLFDELIRLFKLLKS